MKEHARVAIIAVDSRNHITGVLVPDTTKRYAKVFTKDFNTASKKRLNGRIRAVVAPILQ
jgi:hypothetical protein